MLYEVITADDVLGGDRRKVGPVGLARLGIDGPGTGRAVGRAQHVGADDEEAVGIDRLARPDEPGPPAIVVARGMRAAGVPVAQQDP